MTYTLDATRGALVGIAKDAPRDIELRLAPTVRVSGRVRYAGQAGGPAWLGSSWTLAGRFRAVFANSTGGEVRVHLPAGDCSWSLYDSYFSPLESQRTLDPRQPEVDLGVLELPLHYLAEHEGKVLPDWTVTEARGVTLEDSGIAAFRGKWLLVEFWGYW